MLETDVFVVGAGPIGIELAVALRRAGVGYVHVDAGQIGATMQWWAPGTQFFSSPERISIAGVPLLTPNQQKATREEYLAYLRGVVEQFDLEIRTYERVVGIERAGEGGGSGAKENEGASPGRAMSRFEVATRGRRGERRYRARRLVLAIGDMQRPRLLGIPGEDLPHVSHYLRDPHEYFRAEVLIVGGKNSAVEAAIRLYRAGARVTLSYRGGELDEKRVKYWLLPEIKWLIDKGRIAWLPRTAPVRISAGGVELARTDKAGCAVAGEPGAALDPDFVLLLTGYEQDPTLFELAGVELVGERRRPRHNYATMETNAPGVYVAGTASAGTQTGGVKEFIETAHVHVDRIVAAITGKHGAGERKTEMLVREAADLPES